MYKLGILLKAVLSFIFATFLFSCGSDDSPPPVASEISTPGSVALLDVSNTGGANDLEFIYELTSTDNIAEIRLYLVKEDQAGTFNISQAQTSANDHYQVINVSVRKIRVVAGQLDSDGDPIVEDVSYVAFALALSSNVDLEDKLSSSSGSLTLQQLSAVSTLTDPITAGSGGMDADDAGNIYMGDFGPNLNGGGSRVIKITSTGVVSTYATGLNGASGNDFDPDGNLFQSNITGSFISKIAPDGSTTTFASSGIMGPVGVVVADDGSLFVANCGNNTIWKVNPGGTTEMFSDSPLLATCPNGIDMDAAGNVYTALFGNGNIIKITPDGTASIFANIPGANNGHLLIRGDVMYVIARSAHQVYTVDMNSTVVSLLAGTGARGSTNGPLSQASFSFPNDLAFSPDGTKIYINDVDPSAGDQSNISPVVIRVIDLVD